MPQNHVQPSATMFFPLVVNLSLLLAIGWSGEGYRLWDQEDLGPGLLDYEDLARLADGGLLQLPKRSGSNSQNAGSPMRPKKLENVKEREKYVAALNTYYMLFGRPR